MSVCVRLYANMHAHAHPTLNSCTLRVHHPTTAVALFRSKIRVLVYCALPRSLKLSSGPYGDCPAKAEGLNSHKQRRMDVWGSHGNSVFLSYALCLHWWAHTPNRRVSAAGTSGKRTQVAKVPTLGDNLLCLYGDSTVYLTTPCP